MNLTLHFLMDGLLTYRLKMELRVDWKEIPCKCGFTSENDREEFELHEMEMVKWMGEYQPPKKIVTRCKTCKTVCIIQRDNLNDC